MIVDLAVEWQPESELSDDEVRAQRARVQQAEDEVLRALGPHGRLRRQLHETAQTSLLVDADGLAMLRRHPRVVKVQEDRAEPAGAG